MATEHAHIKTLIDKLEGMSSERLNEIEDFIDFLRQRDNDQNLSQTASKVAERSFANVWDNSDDSIYDKL